MSQKLVIFDIDGTICDSQETEEACYARAIESVTGQPLATTDWVVYEEPTGSGIIREILVDDPKIHDKEAAIKAEFVRLLESEQPQHPEEFSPIPGVIEFIKKLQEKEGYAVAIATGCFDASAAFKLRCCGIDVEDYPFASSSDTPCRRDIFPLAAQRAGFDLSSAIFFGDGQWDVKATRELGIPMIGIGRGIEKLKELGIQYVFRDYTNPEAILDRMKDLLPTKDTENTKVY